MAHPDTMPGIVSGDQDSWLQIGLERLKDEQVWTLAQAELTFGAYLRPMVEKRLIEVTPSQLGPVALLDMEGRRRVNLPPHQHISLDRHINLLYLRMVAEVFGWTIEREAHRGRHSLKGTLDRLPICREGTQRMFVMAKLTSGGFTPETVTDTFNFIRTTLLADKMRLTVVVPPNGKIKRMADRGALLDLIEFSPVVPPTPEWLRPKNLTKRG